MKNTNTEKHKITQDLVEGFKNMLLSKDKGDINMALNILKERDRSDQESEDNFKKIGNEIINNESLFSSYAKEVWVAKLNGKILFVNGEGAFTDKGRCMGFLSRHLTNFLGTSGSASNSRLVRWNPKVNSYEPDQALITLKNIFGGGKELRDFLVKNNIIEIVNINA